MFYLDQTWKKHLNAKLREAAKQCNNFFQHVSDVDFNVLMCHLAAFNKPHKITCVI